MLQRFLFCLILIATTASSASAQQLTLQPGDRIVLIGNSLFDRMRDYGAFEAVLHSRFPQHKLIVRNLAWSADEVALRPRPDGFGDLNQHLSEHQADVILATFGFNESFKGIEAIPEFETLLRAFLIELKSHRYNGKTPPRIILVSPTPAEKPHEHLNKQLEAYTDAMRRVAKSERVGFANVFHGMMEQFRIQSKTGEGIFTMNGVHLNERGYYQLAPLLYAELFDDAPPHPIGELMGAVVEKEKTFFQYYRPLNYDS